MMNVYSTSYPWQNYTVDNSTNSDYPTSDTSDFAYIESWTWLTE